MKTQIAAALIIAAVFLLPSSSQARMYNTDTGRFQTMDTYDGNQEDPQTLHRYTYGADDPVNNEDPTGNDFEALEIGDMLAGFDGFVSIAGVAESEINPVTSVTLTSSHYIIRSPNGYHWNLYGDVKFANRKNLIAVQWLKGTVSHNGQPVPKLVTGGPLDGQWHIDSDSWLGDAITAANLRAADVSTGYGVTQLVNTESEVRYLDQPGYYRLKVRDIYSESLDFKLVVYNISSATPTIVKESQVLKLRQGGLWRN